MAGGTWSKKLYKYQQSSENKVYPIKSFIVILSSLANRIEDIPLPNPLFQISDMKFSILFMFAIRTPCVVCFDKDDGSITIKHKGNAFVFEDGTDAREIKNTVLKNNK